jgi:hypothetical protein
MATELNLELLAASTCPLRTAPGRTTCWSASAPTTRRRSPPHWPPSTRRCRRRRPDRPAGRAVPRPPAPPRPPQAASPRRWPSCPSPGRTPSSRRWTRCGRAVGGRLQRQRARRAGGPAQGRGRLARPARHGAGLRDRGGRRRRHRLRQRRAARARRPGRRLRHRGAAAHVPARRGRRRPERVPRGRRARPVRGRPRPLTRQALAALDADPGTDLVSWCPSRRRPTVAAEVRALAEGHVDAGRAGPAR